jgi:hypothetical protein
VSPAEAPIDALREFLRTRLRAGDGGKSFLLGYRAAQPCFALAAGLRGEPDHSRFLLFARYLLHHRFACDGHALLMPADLAGRAVYAVEHRDAHGTSAGLLDADLVWRPGGLPPGLIGDLARREAALPGRLRRDLDALYEAVRVDL